MKRRCQFLVSYSCLAWAIVWTAFAWSANAPDEPPPSRYAPADLLATQINDYVKKIGESTDSDEYGDEQQARVARDASTIVALAQILGRHDEDHRWKPAAAGIVAAARKLADASSKVADARQALGELREQLSKPGASGAVVWEPRADSALLMKQVPIVNNSLRRGVTGRRFEQSRESLAAQAATLAVIAQVSQWDGAYCDGEEQRMLWVQLNRAMRDAASETLLAVRRGDQPAATASLERMMKQCDACHRDFRD